MRSRLASAPSTKATARPTATMLIRSVSWCIEACAVAILGVAVWRMRVARSNPVGFLRCFGGGGKGNSNDSRADATNAGAPVGAGAPHGPREESSRGTYQL